MNTEKHPVGEPAGLGLLGLALVTLVASSEKLGLTEGLTFVLPWAIFLGATAQLLASWMDFKRHNVFGGTAFGGYAFFWFAVAMTWMCKLGAFGPALATHIDGKQLGFAFVGYLIFTLYMTLGSMETNKVLFFIFFSIDILFIGLSMSAFGIAPAFALKLAGTAEFIIALLSFYGSAATVLNTHFGRVFLPTGKPFGIFKPATEAAH